MTGGVTFGAALAHNPRGPRREAHRARSARPQRSTATGCALPEQRGRPRAGSSAHRCPQENPTAVCAALRASPSTAHSTLSLSRATGKEIRR